MNRRVRTARPGWVALSFTWLLGCLALLDESSFLVQCTLAQDTQSKVCVFLVTGKGTEGLKQEELIAKQNAHMQNFKRLAQEKVLVGVGPTSDPAGIVRGMVTLNAENPLQLDQFFTKDPYVTEGYMKTEGNLIIEMDGELRPELDTTKIEEYKLAIWKRKDPNTAKGKGEVSSSSRTGAIQAHQRYWSEYRTSGRMALRMRFGEESPRYGIAIFPAVSEGTLLQWLAADPMAQNGFIEYQVMPQYMVRGSVQLK